MAEDDIDLLDDDDGNIEHTYLTFRACDEEYAVPVLNVTEIVRLQRTFSVPDVPKYVRGVINLRGKVIPLLDIRGRFGLPEVGYTDRTAVVVVEVLGAASGLVVDSVCDVAEIPPDLVDERSLRAKDKSSLVRGMARREGGITFILDMEALLDGDMQTAASSVQAPETAIGA